MIFRSTLGEALKEILPEDADITPELVTLPDPEFILIEEADIVAGAEWDTDMLAILPTLDILSTPGEYINPELVRLPERSNVSPDEAKIEERPGLEEAAPESNP